MKAKKLAWTLFPLVILLLAALIAVYHPNRITNRVYALEIGEVADSSALFYNCYDAPRPQPQNVSEFGGKQNREGGVFLTEAQTSFRLCIPGNEVYVADLIVFPMRALGTTGGAPTYIQISFLTPAKLPEDREIIFQEVYPIKIGGDFEFEVVNQFGQLWLITWRMTKHEEEYPKQDSTIRLRFSVSLRAQMVN